MGDMGPGFMIAFFVSLIVLFGTFVYLNSIYQFG